MRTRKFLEPGQRFGEWTVLRFSHLEGTADLYDCRCGCGFEAKVRKRHMKTGASQRCKHCGPAKHGKSRTDVFAIWQTMKARCDNPRHAQYHRYGARGVQVCERWASSFEAFASDIGPRPSPEHSVDRIDGNGNYEPGNVRWATQSEQAQNRRTTRYLTIDGETLCVAEWARRANVNNHTIHERLKRGWTPRDAVFTPASNATEKETA